MMSMKRRKKWSGMIAAAAVPVFIVGAFAAGSNSMMMKKPASSMMMMMKNQNRYGGMIYTGKPMLNITASLLKAGGGGPNFSIAKALTSMVGSKAVNAEVAKLKKQYGAMRVARFIQLTDYGVKDAYYKSVRAGVKLPRANLSGKKLAITLVQLGVNSNGVFYEGTQLDKLISHKTHMAVMNDFDNKKGFGEEADKDYHRITNQAMYDLAHALGMKNVKLAPLH